MNSSAFLLPPPLFRRVIRPATRSSPTAMHGGPSQPPPDGLSPSMVRLLSMQKTILKRRDHLRSSSNPDQNETQLKQPDQQLYGPQSTQQQSQSQSVLSRDVKDDSTDDEQQNPENVQLVGHDGIALANGIASPNSKPTSKDPFSFTSPVSTRHADLGLASTESTPPELPDTFESQLTILRHNVRLPWKGYRQASEDTEPTEVPIPHLRIFTEGMKIPQPTFSDDMRNPPRNSDPRAINRLEVLRPLPNGFGNMPDEAAAEAILGGLNERQREAVVADCGCACLVLAGPGSGKTRVLTHRIAYLIKAHRVPSWAILAVTFTNKAAAEMKLRVENLLTEHSGDDSEDAVAVPRLTVGTFHWIAARLLRMYGEHAGIPPDFDICDAQDARSVVARVLTTPTDPTPDSSRVFMTAAMISKLKNDKESDLRARMPRLVDRLVELRRAYDKQLRSMNMLDFDDLLVEARRMLRECPDVLAQLQSRFQYVLVDEWQDTNNVQFDIVHLLSGNNRNLFVVGDVDQSIYKFRGADSGNIQRYTEMFDDAKQIVLSTNYRSTVSIIDAAQAVIEQNRNRPKKEMTTVNELGEKVHMISVTDGRIEAQLVTASILRMKGSKDISSFSDCAIMYRTNAQSRLLEEACVQNRIPYILQSGTRFFERKEIKDVLAYLKILNNSSDDNAVLRVINNPPRGIGKRTIERIEAYAQEDGVMLLAAIEKLVANQSIGDSFNIRPAELLRVRAFYELICRLRDLAEGREQLPSDVPGTDIGALVSTIVKVTGYSDYLQSEKSGDEKNKIRDRLDNIAELVRGASRFKESSAFLERAALMSDANARKDEDGDGAVWLTTLHGSKGLEFKAVFITGAEDGIIPMMRDGQIEDIEEERRLLYVGMTRAKRFLTVTWRTKQSKKTTPRGDAGGNAIMKLSRFLRNLSGVVVREIGPESTSGTTKKRYIRRKSR